jgi:hypothetical protein
MGGDGRLDQSMLYLDRYVQDLYFPTWKIPEDHLLVAGGKDTRPALFGRDPEVGKWTFSTNGAGKARHSVHRVRPGRRRQGARAERAHASGRPRHGERFLRHAADRPGEGPQLITRGLALKAGALRGRPRVAFEKPPGAYYT